MIDRFVWRMAWRETRGSRRRLTLLTAAIVAGVAALVAVNSFAANLRTAVADQALALFGADLTVNSRQQFTAATTALLDSLVAPDSAGGLGGGPGEYAVVVSFNGMAYVPRTDGVRLVQVAAVDPGYPYYGAIVTAPAEAWTGLQDGGKVLVDPGLLTSLGGVIGDTLALGQSRFVIAATVINQPGNVAAASAFTSRIYIAAKDLDGTGLLQYGSRAEYEAFVKLAKPDRATEISRIYRPVLRPERAGIRSVEQNRSDLTEALTQLSNYLGLVALIALLLGGMGVASAVHVFIRQKLDTIAVLRVLGADTGRLFAVYLLQAIALGALGSLIGAMLGGALQRVLPMVLADLLPVDVTVALDPGAVLLGLGLGLWVSVMFALMPLLAIRRVSPLRTLRRNVEQIPGRDRARILAAVAVVASVGGLAAVQAGRLRDGIAFTIALGVVVVTLWLASLAMIRGLRRWFPSRWPYVWRQGLANLYRPGNQTVTVVLSLGFGAFLLSTLFLVQHNLLRDLNVAGVSARPNLAFLDIQPDQREGVVQQLRDAGVERVEAVAMIPMRVASIKGRPVVIRPPSETDSIPPDSLAVGAGWAMRREYRSSYRDTLVDSEVLVEGAWWDGPRTDPSQPVEVSLEVDIAADLQVTLGDEIVWDVQGIKIPSRVTSTRRVDWARFEPNFFAVFQGGALEQAPGFSVSLVRLDDPAERGRLQRSVAERYPNVTSIDLGSLQKLLEQILGRVSLAIRFMAGFSLATGAVVLIGAIATTRFQRVREAVLLKTLGAQKRQVLLIFLAEYLALGLLAAGMAVGLSTAAGWGLAKFIFDTSFAIPAGALGTILLVILALTVGIGLVSSLDILRRTPLEVLRNE